MTRFLVILISIVIGPRASAAATSASAPVSAPSTFVQSPKRDDGHGFPSFFLKRFVRWAIPMIDKDKKFSPTETLYIETFAQTAQRFGLQTNDGFLRSIDIRFSSENVSVWYLKASARFLDVESRADLRALALKVLKERAPAFDSAFLKRGVVGLGFSPSNSDIEVLIKDDHLDQSPWLQDFSPKARDLIKEQVRGVIVLGLKNSKLKSVEVIQTGVQLEKRCPPVTASSQADRVVLQNGVVRVRWHVEQFEALALDPIGRRIYEDVWKVLNINPGLVEWVSPKDYALTYP